MAYVEYEQTQYGGARAPSVEPQSGGAALMSNLGSAALGMLSAGGVPAIQAAMEVAKETPTSQTAQSTNTQSTGSKSFGTPAGSSGIAANSFWQATVSNASGSGNVVLLLAAVVAISALYFVFKRK